MNDYKKWRRIDVLYLKKYYKNSSAMDIAIYLDRGVNSVRNKACRLGLKRDITGDGNSQWKGDDVGYSQLHYYISKYKEKPISCPKCGNKTRWLDLSNISGEYKRDVNDFEWLCRTCHNVKDKDKNRKRKRMEEIFNGDLRILE